MPSFQNDNIDNEDYQQLLDLYNELIYAVERKFPDETRHQTALRYIHETERTANNVQPASSIIVKSVTPWIDPPTGKSKEWNATPIVPPTV